MAHRLKGIFAILLGVVITALSIITMWLLLPKLWTAVGDIPVVGPGILDVLRHMEFPADRVFFPLLGIYVVFWGIALSAHKSWARLMGGVISGILGVYVLALMILIVPLRSSFTDQYRWLILLIGLLLTCWLAYQTYTFLSPKAEKDFAQKWKGQVVVTTCDRCGQDLDRRGQCPHCEPVLSRRASATEVGTQAPEAKSSEPSMADPTTDPTGVMPIVPELLAEQRRSRATPRPRTAQRHAAGATSDGTRQVLAALVAADGSRFEITKQETLIGRDSACDLPISDSSVSRRHAILTLQDAQFTLRDTESTNGTYVNGERLDPAANLASGDQVMIGRVTMAFESFLPPGDT